MQSLNHIQLLSLKYPYFMDIQIGEAQNDPPHPAGYICGPLIRDFFTMQLCTGGKGVLTSDGKQHAIEKGQLFVTFPNTVVEERADEEEPWSHLWVLLRGEQVRACFESLGFSPKTPVFSKPFNYYIESCMMDLISTGRTQDVFNQIYQLRCICNILVELSVLHGHTPKTLDRVNLSNRYVHDAIHYIEVNYVKRITVNDIATSVGINRSYLYTLFKQHAGMSLQDYLITFRIKKACTFLSFPEASISTVAYSVGYEPLVFSKTFKQIMGVSPREYRKQILRQNGKKAQEKKA